MPGGRLTQQDRQKIAAGLAAGLGYGVIARRLGRPTSTVTREVARNGGPNGYRADQAQQATAQRARRSKPAPERAPAPSVADPYGRDPEVVRGVEEEFTELMVQTGLPRMAARVLVCLYVTDGGSLTAGDLVQRLRVSPASVCKAIGYLEAQELIRRKRDERRERYLIDGDIWYRSLLASAQRNATMAAAARRSAEVLGAGTPAGTRLVHAAEFLQQLGEDIIQAAHHRRNRRPREMPRT